MQVGKYNTFSYGSEGYCHGAISKIVLYISMLSHGSEGSFSVSLVANRNSFDDYIN